MISVGHGVTRLESKIPQELALNSGSMLQQRKDKRLIQINDRISMFKVVSHLFDESQWPNGPIVDCLEMVNKGEILIEYYTKTLDGRDTVDRLFKKY